MLCLRLVTWRKASRGGKDIVRRRGVLMRECKGHATRTSEMYIYSAFSMAIGYHLSLSRIGGCIII